MEMKILVVVPTYNEVGCLERLVDSIFSQGIAGLEVLLVDDASTDGTSDLADVLSRRFSGMHVLHRAGKLGLGTAYLDGFRWGLQKDFSHFIQMDADFSHHPQYLMSMVGFLKTSPVVVGSRYVSGGGTLHWSWGRRYLSRFGGIYARWILKVPIADFTGGFNGWSRQVLESLDLSGFRSDGYAFQIELKYRAFQKKFKIFEFPIIFEDRQLGESKMSWRIVFEALVRIWGFRCRSRG
jgi:dolichol-phosphate mannosyltransferase